MRSSLVSQAVSLIALAFLATAESASDVLSLTAANFDSSVKPEPLILVEFFAPWYGHKVLARLPY
jgi:protein disulfide-isomerase A1